MDEDQGAMTSPTLTALLADAVARRFPGLDARAIAPVNDFFIWGVILGLMDAAGVELDRATVALKQPSGTSFGLLGVEHPTAPAPSVTDTLVLRARASTPREGDPTQGADADEDRAGKRLAALLRRDFLAHWSVSGASRALGLSGRSLQRALRKEGTTFSEVLLRTRAVAAHAMLEEPELALTDIAFCVGFADQAHFSRTYRRFFDVPPSALRGVAEVE